jgi:hypothetical protein
MQLLLAGGANVNAHDEVKIGETTLSAVAAATRSVEMAQLLVGAGADPTIMPREAACLDPCD